MLGIQTRRKVEIAVGSCANDTNELVLRELLRRLCTLEEKQSADCLTYIGPIAYGADDDIRDAIEDIPHKREKLLFILQTYGGYTETARRIADVLRHHYKLVDFLVPGYAMSAGTILVMSGDAIHMDYYSVLGPIDPQIECDGKLVPALGYLARYEKLLRKANRGKVSTAEMRILLSFDQNLLYAYEQARALSFSLLEEWLVKYKFKDWHITQTRKIPVTLELKKRRAREIARKLCDIRLWNSHGIGINLERLRSVCNLQINDFGQAPELR